MKKFLLPAIVLSVSLFAQSLLVPSPAYAVGGTGKSKVKTNAPETYIVIKVTDDNKTEKNEKKIEYKAIAKSQLKDERKRGDDEYKTKTKEWHDLRKTDPSAPAPKRIKIQVIQSDYETQKIAQDYADKKNKELEDKDAGDDKPPEKK